MAPSTSIVIVDSDPFRRNEVSRLFYAESRHVEPYESFEELESFWPSAGIILVYDDENALQNMFELMLQKGCWLPVIVYAVDPEPGRIVDVVLMGAMDYWNWPVSPQHVAERFKILLSRRKTFSELRRRANYAQKRVEDLSPREREVLFCLAAGESNKGIARELGISPRTIEIHRANMMQKLGANHVSQAISIALYSGLASLALEQEGFDPLAVGS